MVRSPEKKDVEPKKYNIETLIDTDPYQHIFKNMKNTNTIILGSNIVLDKASIKSYILGDNKYIFINREEDNLGKKFMGEQWNGETITGIVYKIVREFLSEKNIQSTPNNTVNEILKIEGVKWRTHLGLTDNSVNIVDTDKALDINKCYRACMEKPTEKFMKFDFNSLPQAFMEDDEYKLYNVNKWDTAYTDKKIKLGFYYVITKDTTLFHKTNIYSSAIVKIALNDGIITPLNIRWYIPGISVENPFPELIKRMKEKASNDEELTKCMINYISGIIGKDNYTRTNVNISTDIKECFNFVKNQNDKCFIKPNEDKSLFLYGIKNSKSLAEHNLPIYLQILDQSNIRLYNLIKSVNAIPIYRKTDMVVFRDLLSPVKEQSSKLANFKTNNKIGGVKWEQLPSSIFLNKYDIRDISIEDPTIKPQVEMNLNINSSDQSEEVFESLYINNGCMLIGDAGTGKSYVIHKLTEKIGNENIAKICFTNKGAININGTTIHKFLQLDDKGKMNSKRITSIKNSVKYIMIDEISMIDKNLWRILSHLHYMTDIPFLLVGDDKQLPPVENCNMDYFNHPEILKMINHNIIHLTKIQRYDMKLKQMSNNVMNINPKDFTDKVADKNICYTNKTRILVNGYLNDHKIKSIPDNERLYIKKSISDVDSTQPFWLYNGLPMIARTTKGQEHVNNEEFVVMDFNNDEVMLMAERPEGAHVISIKLSLLTHRFLVAYCITTHKAQGSTIDSDITIWDWNLMTQKLRYTAITRVKNASQLNFHSV
jgi:hypothetical protein